MLQTEVSIHCEAKGDTPAVVASTTTDTIEAEILAGKIKHTGDHLWSLELGRESNAKNPSIFDIGGYYLILSRTRAGVILIEVVSAYGVEGGFLHTSEVKADVTYEKLVNMGSLEDTDENVMLRICRDEAGNLSLVIGKGTRVIGETRTFTSTTNVFDLEKMDALKIYKSLSKYLMCIALRMR